MAHRQDGRRAPHMLDARIYLTSDDVHAGWKGAPTSRNGGNVLPQIQIEGSCEGCVRNGNLQVDQNEGDR